MRAVFFRKEPEIEAKEFCVEKVIVLPTPEYESFIKHLMHDYDFIRDNVDLMCEKDGPLASTVPFSMYLATIFPPA